MSPSLERMRDELAEGVINEPLVCSPQYIKEVKAGFRLGWEAAIKALEQEAGKFDEQQTRKEIVRRYDSCSQHDVEIARMMFASDRARIGLQDSINKALASTNRKFQADIKQLEARIKELEVKLIVSRDQVVSARKERDARR